jgi:itaconate CoA-transferase
MRPLDGITVVSVEQAVAGALATRHLADLGARGYDGTVLGLSAYFVWLNRSKESLTLVLEHRRAKEIMARLIERAEAIV